MSWQYLSCEFYSPSFIMILHYMTFQQREKKNTYPNNNRMLAFAVLERRTLGTQSANSVSNVFLNKNRLASYCRAAYVWRSGLRARTLVVRTVHVEGASNPFEPGDELRDYTTNRSRFVLTT